MTLEFNQYYYTYISGGGLRVVASSCPERNVEIGNMCMSANFDPSLIGSSLQLMYNRASARFLYMKVQRLDTGEGERTPRFIHAYELCDGEDLLAPECFLAPDSFFDGEGWRAHGEVLPKARFESLAEGWNSAELCEKLRLTRNDVIRLIDQLYADVVFGTEHMTVLFQECGEGEMEHLALNMLVLLQRLTPVSQRHMLSANTNIPGKTSINCTISFTNAPEKAPYRNCTVSYNGGKWEFPHQELMLSGDARQAMIVNAVDRMYASDQELAVLLSAMDNMLRQGSGDCIRELPQIALRLAGSGIVPFSAERIKLGDVIGIIDESGWKGSQREFTELFCGTVLAEAAKLVGDHDRLIKLINVVLRVARENSPLSADNACRILARVFKKLHSEDAAFAGREFAQLNVELSNSIDAFLDAELSEKISYIPERFKDFGQLERFWKAFPRFSDPERSRSRLLERVVTLVLEQPEPALMRKTHDEVRMLLGGYAGEYETGLLNSIAKKNRVSDICDHIDILGSIGNQKEGKNLVCYCVEIAANGNLLNDLESICRISRSLGVDEKTTGELVSPVCCRVIDAAGNLENFETVVDAFVERTGLKSDVLMNTNVFNTFETRILGYLNKEINGIINSPEMNIGICKKVKELYARQGGYIGKMSEKLDSEIDKMKVGQYIRWINMEHIVSELEKMIADWNSEVISDSGSREIAFKLGEKMVEICRGKINESFADQLAVLEEARRALGKVPQISRQSVQPDLDRIENRIRGLKEKACETVSGSLRSCGSLEEIAAISVRDEFKCVSFGCLKNEVIRVSGLDHELSAVAPNHPGERIKEYLDFISGQASVLLRTDARKEKEVQIIETSLSERIDEWETSKINRAITIDDAIFYAGLMRRKHSLADDKIAGLIKRELLDNLRDSNNWDQGAGIQKIKDARALYLRIYDLEKKTEKKNSFGASKREAADMVRSFLSEFWGAARSVQDLANLEKIAWQFSADSLKHSISVRIMEFAEKYIIDFNSAREMVDAVLNLCSSMDLGINNADLKKQYRAMWEKRCKCLIGSMLGRKFSHAKNTEEIEETIECMIEQGDFLDPEQKANWDRLGLGDEIRVEWDGAFRDVLDNDEKIERCNKILQIQLACVKHGICENMRRYVSQCYIFLAKKMIVKPEDIHKACIPLDESIDEKTYELLRDHIIDIIKNTPMQAWEEIPGVLDDILEFTCELGEYNETSAASISTEVDLVNHSLRGQEMEKKFDNAISLEEANCILERMAEEYQNSKLFSQEQWLAVQNKVISIYFRLIETHEQAVEAKKYVQRVIKKNNWFCKPCLNGLQGAIKARLTQYAKETKEQKKAERSASTRKTFLWKRQMSDHSCPDEGKQDEYDNPVCSGFEFDDGDDLYEFSDVECNDSDQE